MFNNPNLTKFQTLHAINNLDLVHVRTSNRLSAIFVSRFEAHFRWTVCLAISQPKPHIHQRHHPCSWHVHTAQPFSHQPFIFKFQPHFPCRHNNNRKFRCVKPWATQINSIEFRLKRTKHLKSPIGHKYDQHCHAAPNWTHCNCVMVTVSFHSI